MTTRQGDFPDLITVSFRNDDYVSLRRIADLCRFPRSPTLAVLRLARRQAISSHEVSPIPSCPTAVACWRACPHDLRILRRTTGAVLRRVHGVPLSGTARRVIPKLADLRCYLRPDRGAISLLEDGDPPKLGQKVLPGLASPSLVQLRQADQKTT